MNTVLSIDTRYEPAANSAPAWTIDETASTRAAAARGFLIQLVAREIQIADRCAVWLRGAAEGERLVEGTRALRSELVVLLHRLVARRNRLNPQRRLDVIAILAQPLSPVMDELFELHESATSWLGLACLRPIEQMLATTIPLSIDITRADDSDLREAAQLFAARQRRADELASLLAEIVAADRDRAALVHAAEDQAIACFAKILSECSEIGQDLDNQRRGFVRL